MEVQEKRKRIYFEKNEILSLMGIFFLGFSTAMFSPYAPIWLVRIFNVESYFILGFTAIIPNFVIIFGTTLWGIAADKFGNKPFVLIGILGSALMYFTLLFINNAIIFLVILLLGNILISAQTSNIYSFATVNSTKNKETILGEITAMFSLSWLVSSPLAAFIHDNAYTFSIKWYTSVSFEQLITPDSLNPSNFISVFATALSKFFSTELAQNPSQGVQLFIAVVSCVISFIIVLFTKEKKPEKQEQSDKLKGISKGKITEFMLVFSILMVITFFQQATSGGFWAYASLFYIDLLQTPAIYFGYFLVATTGLGIVLSLLLGRITKINGIMIGVVVCTLIQLGVYIIIAVFPTNSTLGLIVYSFPMYVVSGVFLYSLVGTFSNKLRRSTAYGIYNTVGFSGLITIVLLMGFAADRLPQGIMILPVFATITSVFPVIFSVILFIHLLRNKALF